MAEKPSPKRSIAKNRKARHDYHVLETMEAGLVLQGTEVKSLRNGQASLVGSFVRLRIGEAHLVDCQIPEYRYGNRMNHEPKRDRKLLLHAREIRKWFDQVRQERLTVVPLELYFRGPRAKVEIALVRGKRQADKRQDMAKRDAKRDMDRAMRRRR